MKYLKYVIVFIMFSCINAARINALSCSNATSKELGAIASYVKVDYEVIDNSETLNLSVEDESTTYFIPNYKFIINVYNITDQIYAKIEDETLQDYNTIYYKDTQNNVYNFTNYDFGKIHNYKITLYSALEECYGEAVRTIRFTTPKYNAYSEYKYCENSSNLYCQKFTEKELKIENSEDFLKKIKPNNEINKPIDDSYEEKETIKDLMFKNKGLYALIFISIIGITVTIILIVKKKNKKDKGWYL